MKNRPLYMRQLISFKDRKEIKIITGIRRSGKSTLLSMFADELIAGGVQKNKIIWMNFESLKYRALKNYEDLYEAISGQISSEGKTYILLDEVQMVEHWEKAIDSFQVDFDVDIYITGSNAYLLSSELSTLIAGRYVEIKVLPLSFQEFVEFNAFPEDSSKQDKFAKYVRFGGMPALTDYHFEETMTDQVLEGIYSAAILKDVVMRNNITDQVLLQKLILFMADNIGNLTSLTNISNSLVAEGNLAGRGTGKAPAVKTVEAYLDMLKKAYVFYGIKRYDIKGKQFLKTLEKYYIVDTGFRNMLLGYRDVDRGHVLENIVFFELLRRGYRVSIGKLYNKEVDFIAEKAREKIYIQVTETIFGETTRERELAPLRAIKDAHPKLVLSMDHEFMDSEDGIKIRNVIEFLLDPYD